MNYFVFAALALCGLIFQSALFQHLSVADVKPDFILILALVYSIFQGPGKGLAVGFFLGLLEDLFLGRFIGMNALAKGISGAFIGWLTKSAFQENILVPIFSLFIGTLLNQLVYFCLGKFLGLSWPWSLWLWKGWPLALYNTCLVPLIYSYFFNWAAKENAKKVL